LFWVSPAEHAQIIIDDGAFISIVVISRVVAHIYSSARPA